MLLKALLSAGHGLELIAFILGIQAPTAQALARSLGLSDPIDRPMRRNTHPRAWTPEQYRLFAKLWITGARAVTIAETIGRSTSSVYRKRAFLNLPKRPRPSRALRDLPTHKPNNIIDAIETIPIVTSMFSIIRRPEPVVASELMPLPWEVAASMGIAERIGMRWRVRNSPFDLVLTTHRTRSHVCWKKNPLAQRELGMRFISGQRVEATAREMAVPVGSVQSILSKIGLDRRSGIRYVDTFDMNLAEENMRRQNYEFFADRNFAGWQQWYRHGSGLRVSRMFKKSAAYKNASAGL